MGREIRRVPPSWDHPKKSNGEYQPMHDRSYHAAIDDWRREFGDEAGNQPERECYRPWEESEATWYQLWETVSAGTPVSPPFETKEQLAAYLATCGDFWDQKRGRGGCGMDAAEAFVEVGWAPSLVAVRVGFAIWSFAGCSGPSGS